MNAKLSGRGNVMADSFGVLFEDFVVASYLVASAACRYAFVAQVVANVLMGIVGCNAMQHRFVCAL
jgi:hypothetical protein